MLQDLDKETVEWQPNYDDSMVEPVVLPSKVPQLLINGSAGIAVGMATNIPPHNLTEIMTALISLLEKPDLTIDELMEMIPGPDFPTAGTIFGRTGIVSAYKTGKGIIQVRGNIDVEEYGNDRNRLILRDLPYQVNKAKLIERIAELVHEKVITGISDIRDESNKEGIRVAIDLKKNEIPTVIINQLYKTTPLQSSFGIIFLSIMNGVPRVLNLKEQLDAFNEHRREIIIRRTLFDLKKAKERAHLLLGLKIAVENIDEVVELIKKSAGPKEAKESLITRFELSEVQSQAILDLRLQRLTGLERDKIIKEYNEVIALIAHLESILSDEIKIKQIIKEEYLDIVERYGDERRTKIEGHADEILVEDLIKREEQLVTITHKGYLKRMSLDTYKTQKRGGVGVRSADSGGEDFFTSIFRANTHANMLVFTHRGNVFKMKVYQIPEAQRTGKGRNIVNLLPIQSGDTVKEIICVTDEMMDENHFLIMATERGIIKKTPMAEYVHINQNGKKAIKLEDGDSIRNVRVSDGKKDVLLCASSGKVIRFNEEDCRPMGRVSRGVKGITIDEKENVIGMELIDDNVELLSVTEKGFGKRTQALNYRKTNRGGKGILAMKLNEKTGEIVSIKPVSDKDDLMIITDKGLVIRTKMAGISLLGRATSGVRIIKLKEGESVVSVESFIDQEDNEEDTDIQ